MKKYCAYCGSYKNSLVKATFVKKVGYKGIAPFTYCIGCLRKDLTKWSVTYNVSVVREGQTYYWMFE